MSDNKPPPTSNQVPPAIPMVQLNQGQPALYAPGRTPNTQQLLEQGMPQQPLYATNNPNFQQQQPLYFLNSMGMAPGQMPMYAPNSQSPTMYAAAAAAAQRSRSPARPGRTYHVPKTFAKTFTVKPSEHSFYESFREMYGNFLGSLWCCISDPFHVVDQGNIGIIQRFGKVVRIVDPGNHYVNPITETLIKIPVQLNTTPLSNVQAMTKDNVKIIISALLSWQVLDPMSASFQVQNIFQAVSERTVAVIRYAVGTLVLQAFIENREALAKDIQQQIGSIAKEWGVSIESVLISDVKFTNELQESLAEVAKKKRVGESKIIAARAEIESARLMREAAEILNTPAAMQIRYLETIQAMSKQPNCKIVFLEEDDVDTNMAQKAWLLENMADLNEFKHGNSSESSHVMKRFAQHDHVNFPRITKQ